MDEKEVNELKERICRQIVEQIKTSTVVDKKVLIADHFSRNGKEVEEILNNLTDGQIIRPNNRVNLRYIAGLKFNSFKTYKEFSKEVNFGDRNRYVTNRNLIITGLVISILVVFVPRACNKGLEKDETTEELSTEPVTSSLDSTRQDSSYVLKDSLSY